MTRPRRRLIGLLLLAVLVPAGLAGAWAGFLALSGNVHEVVAGELFRSGQLSPGGLQRVIARDGIRSIVNLQGSKPDEAWYRDEIRVAATAGVVHKDFRWSASRVPTAEEVDAFLAVVRTLPKPILVHCRSGADRTGLAVALYLAVLKHADEATAEAQLSFRYGHVGLPFTRAWAMDETFEREERRILGYDES